MRQCVVNGCDSKSNNYVKTDKIAFVKFPVNPNVREAWINALQHSNKQLISDADLNENTRICEKHFQSQDIRYNKCRSSLEKLAVPTIFSNDDDMETEYLVESERINEFQDEWGIQCRNVVEPLVSMNEETHVFYCENCGHVNSKRTERNDTVFDDRQVSRKRQLDDQQMLMPPSKKLIIFAENKVQDSVEQTVASFNKPHSNEINDAVQNVQAQAQQPSTPIHDQSKFRPKRLCFAGDVPSDTELTPKSSKKFISSLRKTVIKQRLRIKCTKQTVRRQQQKILSLRGLLDDLKKKNLISENAVELLQLDIIGDFICFV